MLTANNASIVFIDMNEFWCEIIHGVNDFWSKICSFYDANVSMLMNKGSYMIGYQLIKRKTYYNHYMLAYHVLVYYMNEYISIVFVYKLLVPASEFSSLGRESYWLWETQYSEQVSEAKRTRLVSGWSFEHAKYINMNEISSKYWRQ